MSTQLPHHADQPQTELAHWVINFQRKIEPHTSKIILAIIVGTIGIVGYQVMTKSAAARTSAAWSEYAACTSADSYKKVAEDHAGTPVEAWSRLEAARDYIQSGVRLSMTNRKASDESLENGKAQLEKLLNSTTAPDEVREQALSQMAVCLETLCDGDMKPVVEAYQKLVDKYPTSHFTPWAKHRLEELKKPETAEFYTWFRKAQPAPPERPKPQDAKPGELPNVNLFPDDSDPAPPSNSGTAPAAPETKPAVGTPASPATETPAVPAAENKPEGEKPAETPPAPEAKPDAAAPATETPAASAEKPAEAAPEKPAEPAAEAPQP